jgi:hypothetical protein
MKTKKLLFLTVILMLLTASVAVAQRGTCSATSNQYYIINGTQTNDVGTSSSNAIVPTVPIGATVQVGINNGGTYLDNGPVGNFTIAIYKNGVLQSTIQKNVGSYGQGWQPTIPATNFTLGAVVQAVMTVTPASTFNGCTTPWTYTYNFNTSSVCTPNATTFYYSPNGSNGWVDPATPVSGNINIPNLISLGSGAKITVGTHLGSGCTVAYSDGLGWTSTSGGNVNYFPNFVYTVGGSTRTITAVVTNNCGGTSTTTFTVTSANTCTPIARGNFYYNDYAPNTWVDPVTPDGSNNIDIPAQLSTGSATVFEPGIHLNAGSSITWSDASGIVSTSNQFQYHPNMASGDTKVLTATYHDGCGTDTIYTFTLHAATACVPSTATLYYNPWDGSGWHNPTTPVAGNIDVASPLFSLGTVAYITPGIALNGGTVAWSDGAAGGTFNSTTSYQPDYHPNFTAIGQTRTLTAVYTDTCGGITTYTYTIYAVTTCIPAAVTPNYNNGTGMFNAVDASPINFNVELGNTITLGLSNPTDVTTVWNDGLALVNQTSGQFVYAAGFTAAGQTRDVTGSFTNACGTVQSYTFHITSVITKTTWDGAAWSNATPPSSTIEAIIAEPYSTTTNGVFTALKLTVNSGMSLIINTGTSITVENQVVNNGSVVIENNANLIQVNNTANIGNVVVSRNSNALLLYDYTLWSSPVASQNLATFSPSTAINRFYTYDSTSNLYSVLDPNATNFTPGAGYLIRMPIGSNPSTPTAYPGVFTGIPNNGNVPFTMIDGGAGLRYNLVGNPYPSPISMSQFVADNANITGTLYFWRKTNGLGTAYCTWAGGTFTTNGNIQSVDPAGIIQTGQGFFVEANGLGTALTFKNSQRAVNTAGQFFKTKQVAAASRIWLNATNAMGDFSQMAVNYVADATLGVDAFDGKYINDSAFALTSNIDNGEYTIQGRPAFDTSDIVALNFKTDKAGDYTIAIDHTDGLLAAGQDVYLVDSTTGTETNLKTSGYTFTATAGVTNSRFSLKYQKTLKVNEVALNDNSITVYKNNGVVYVNSAEKAINSIKVYDIQGRLIAVQNNVKANVATINNLKATHQVLVIQVTCEDNKVVNKKVEN